MHMARLSESVEMKHLAAKQSLSLLKSIPLLPPDKVLSALSRRKFYFTKQAFYLSGSLCRAAQMDNMAVVFLNRYLDIEDAIEEGANMICRDPVFDSTDIP